MNFYDLHDFHVALANDIITFDMITTGSFPELDDRSILGSLNYFTEVVLDIFLEEDVYTNSVVYLQKKTDVPFYKKMNSLYLDNKDTFKRIQKVKRASREC